MIKQSILSIADLSISVPDMGGFSSHYQDYLTEENLNPDIIIQHGEFVREKYPAGTDEDVLCNLECVRLLSAKLLSYMGCVIHASAVSLDGRAYLFSGPCGIGKSTHAKQWLSEFGSSAVIINDDKPPIRRVDERWFAYGSPWCGKDSIHANMKAALAGICFLKQGTENSIRRLNSNEALHFLLWQTLHRFRYPEYLNMMMELMDKLISEIPVFELVNYPGTESVRLSYETMTAAAEEMGL